jgi:hypothetical protein
MQSYIYHVTYTQYNKKIKTKCLKEKQQGTTQILKQKVEYFSVKKDYVFNT